MNFNALKHNPLLGGGSRAQQGSNSAGDDGTTVDRTPTHRRGDRKDSCPTTTLREAHIAV